MQLYHDPQAKTLVVKMAETHYDDAIDALIAHDGPTATRGTEAHPWDVDPEQDYERPRCAD